MLENYRIIVRYVPKQSAKLAHQSSMFDPNKEGFKEGKSTGGLTKIYIG